MEGSPKLGFYRVKGDIGLCWRYIGIMENKMEATIYSLGFRGVPKIRGVLGDPRNKDYSIFGSI